MDAPVHSRGPATTTGGGTFDLGLGYADERQGFALLMGVGSTPLRVKDDPAAPSTAIFTMGGRYEHRLSRRHPWLRGFGRLAVGGNYCPSEDSAAMEEPDPSCDTPEEARSVGVTTLALGVAVTAVAEPKDDEMTGAFGTIGVAVVYTNASDQALGGADFLGIELSCGFGGDLLSGLLREDD
jgi:hypothetical protein